MRLTVLVLAVGFASFAADLRQVAALEAKGSVAEARTLLKNAAASGNADDLFAYAEFLDRRRDPGAREAYEAALKQASPQRRTAIAGRLKLLDALRTQAPAARKTPWPTVALPGPLRSFNRMAALSPDLPPEDLLGALARNVVTNGYQAASSNEALEQTEYLKLVVRYLSQARELEKLAANGAIRIEQCESTQTADLLKVLGYRMRGGCGSEVVLETVNAARAFLTIDSGFPLSELETALRTNRPFNYDFRPTQIPVLYGPEFWLSAKDKGAPEVSFVDFFLSDPSLCRLYLGLSKLDTETADELKKAIPVARLKAFSHVLDFFGGMFQIRGGKAVVPGAPRSVAGLTEMVGAPPEPGAAFFEKLISRDDGWLASYFDSTARIHGPLQAYLTDPGRMKRYYTAIRGRITSPGPARPVFRANTDMMLLTTRLRMEPNGQPHIPGSVEIWKNLFVNHPHGKYDGKLTKSAVGWKEPDDVIEALFALSRKAVENEPLKIFMALSDLDSRRTKPLEPATVDRLAREYRLYGSQYSIFSEAPGLSDKTILAFLDDAAAISSIRDQGLRADEAGIFQATAGLWQIFCRQGLIPAAEQDSTLAEIVSVYSKARNTRDLFDAGRAALAVLFKATGTPPNADPQERMLDLLSGENQITDADAHTQVVQDMVRIFESQRLISLKTLYDIADNLEATSKGGKINITLVNRLSARIQEIQPARIALSGAEKNALAFGYWTEKHIDNQRKVNFRAIFERSANDPEKLREARGLLTQFLRDTLVGFNYIHYAPPGAQILITNPLFVRSHDFIGVQGTNQTWRSTEVFGTGWPSSAGGRLVGSLSNLPYALAEAEQNFLIPTREQALIWGDLVPQMILSAKVPRWWKVTPSQMHYAALLMRLGESAVAQASLDASVRPRVIELVERQAPPARARRIEELMADGNARAAIDLVLPSEAYLIGSRAMAANLEIPGPEAAEIKRLRAENPALHSDAAVSRAFGTPKPTLANSYSPALMELRTFPTLMGYSSRILAESWESSTLYYAALADEIDLPPSQLNVTVPIWTQKTVEAIFATHLEDWPALLRSLRVVGDGVRTAARKPDTQKASLN
ncbi:MAG: hypothetical protein SFV18_02580 [Bryobacteraceae bacterium]|nr:hypothetical protein [Bryobacteraceae bacterium]